MQTTNNHKRRQVVNNPDIFVNKAASDLCVEVIGDSETELGAIRTALTQLPGLKVEVGASGSFSNPPATLPSCDATLVVVGREHGGALQYIQEQAAITPRPALIAVVSDRSADMMRAILRAGADELLFYPLDEAPATRSLLQVFNSRERARKNNQGKLYVVGSTAGGVGVTTVVANLALALRYKMNKRVAVVDLDARSSGLASVLGLESKETISTLVRDGRAIDSIELGNAMVRHSSGIQLLASPEQLNELEEMSPASIVGVLELMKELFDYVIVDGGGAVNRHVAATWERADEILYVLDQSINGIRCAWRFAEMFEQMKFAHASPSFVINRFDPNHPATEEQVQYALGRAVYAMLPDDAHAMRRSEARGVDIWRLSTGSALVKSYEELGEAIALGKTPPRPARSSVLPRILSVIGARTTNSSEKQAA
jgi:pilus assembly protein CpaE